MNKLETINVTKSFDGRCIIKDISLQVADNQIVCLLGESGIGKSTLFTGLVCHIDIINKVSCPIFKHIM